MGYCFRGKWDYCLHSGLRVLPGSRGSDCDPQIRSSRVLHKEHKGFGEECYQEVAAA